MITKNITNLLARGNLTPREKFLLLIHNDLQRTKTGKEALTPADKETLENWKAKTNEEAHEWNQLNEGWKLSGRMDLMVEIAFKDAQVSHLLQTPIIVGLLMYPGDRRAGFCIEGLKKIKNVTIGEAIEIAKKQKDVKLKEGLDWDYAVYRFAFELLAPEDRKRLNELYEDIEYDHQYLDQEEIITNLYGGKQELGDEAKERLSDLVAENAYNKFAKEYQLFHYFACIPIAEIARYFLKTHDITIAGNSLRKDQQSADGDDDTIDAVTKAIEQYAEDHGTTIKAILRKGCRQWLDHGLLDDYTPLIVSDDAEVLKRWFKAKAKAKMQLLAHIASGQLALRERTDAETRKEKLWSKGLYDSEFASAKAMFEDLRIEPGGKGELDEKKAFEIFDERVLTGESLYAFTGDYEFVKDFKERADTYDANLGLVYADNDPEQKGEHLDQELLICDIAGNGEPSAFSQHGMSVAMLSGLLRAQTLFEEFRKDGKLFLKFKDDGLAKVFTERRETFIESYAILLSLEAILKKLSTIYEADMTEHAAERLATLKEYVERYNTALRIATNTDPETLSSKNWLLREKEPMPFEEDLSIDVDSIKPDQETIEEYREKLRGIFPELR